MWSSSRAKAASTLMVLVAGALSIAVVSRSAAGEASPLAPTITASDGSYVSGSKLSAVGMAVPHDTTVIRTFSWSRCNSSGSCAVISDAHESVYTVGATDVGATLRVTEELIMDGGVSIAQSGPTPTVR